MYQFFTFFVLFISVLIGGNHYISPQKAFTPKKVEASPAAASSSLKLLEKKDIEHLRVNGSKEDQIILTLIDYDKHFYRLKPMTANQASILMQNINQGKAIEVSYSIDPHLDYYLAQNWEII